MPASNKVKAAIIGGSGYTAAELIAILLRHPRLDLAAVASRQGERDAPAVAELHPRFRNRLDLQCEAFDVDRLVDKGIEVAFCCLPHGVSMEAVPALLARRFRVIDLSADYRLRDANVYAQWYKESHRDLANLARAVYGLPEVYGAELPEAQLVANPGCYPQGAVLGLLPLVVSQTVDLDAVIIDAKSGVSGAGRTPGPATHFPECNESVAAYGVGTHRHTPEIEQILTDVAGAAVPVIFTPHLIPMDRGIFTTIYARPRRTVSEGQLLELFRDYYRAAAFVRVASRLPATKDTLHTNFCDVAVRLVRDRIVVLTCLDNLVRGASGVAVQNCNRMFGFAETDGLAP